MFLSLSFKIGIFLLWIVRPFADRMSVCSDAYRVTRSGLSEKSLEDKTYVSNNKTYPVAQIKKAREVDEKRQKTVPETVITLTTVPNRLCSETLLAVIASLLNQTIKPKYVVLNVCTKYNKPQQMTPEQIDSQVDRIQSIFPDLVINRCADYGPGTKLIGICTLDPVKYPIRDDDIIIVVDDDCPMDKSMTQHYIDCYGIYDCDGVCVNEKEVLSWGFYPPYGFAINDHKNIYYDNYRGFAYGWLSFSLKKKHVTTEMIDMLNSLVQIDKSVMYHDDLFFTIYCIQKRLNMCGMNLMFNRIDNLDVWATMSGGLHAEPDTLDVRIELEKKFLELSNIKYVVKNYQIHLLPE
ncbi:hypothetical protein YASMINEVIRUS_746 [Yasminevirus sp. GU-2018]|uniref:Uncharacterized protein n=1 Tax=Yasminevirus sp. GU-2018 TaxID=2420051 RepID=A0A5K0UA16_9VIRU|nr:hypothetical protein YASMINEVIRUS_746 [Yasminevirus sp. GU-2018]